MRTATVVLPVPGAPVKHMWRLGTAVSKPSLRRILSSTRSAAISRTRCFTGSRPTRS